MFGAGQVQDSITIDRDNMQHVEFYQENIDVTTWFVLLSLAGGAGWPHDPGTLARIGRLDVLLRREDVTRLWKLDVGVVLTIDGTQATIGLLQMGALRLYDSTNLEAQRTQQIFPLMLNCEINAGAFKNIGVSTNSNVSSTAVNNVTALTNALGGTTIPAVGDVLVRVEESTIADVDATAWVALDYIVE